LYDINENYVKLPNSIYDDQNITNEELTILLLLYRYYVPYKHVGVCSIQIVSEYMMVDTHNNKKFTATVKEAIQGLLEKRIHN